MHILLFNAKAQLFKNMYAYLKEMFVGHLATKVRLVYEQGMWNLRYQINKPGVGLSMGLGQLQPGDGCD